MEKIGVVQSSLITFYAFVNHLKKKLESRVFDIVMLCY